mgnify:CR=1 FL=1
MNNFIQKLLDDIHNINPELSLKRQTEYNQNFINKALNEQCDIHVVRPSFYCYNGCSGKEQCKSICDSCKDVEKLTQ